MIVEAHLNNWLTKNYCTRVSSCEREGKQAVLASIAAHEFLNIFKNFITNANITNVVKNRHFCGAWPRYYTVYFEDSSDSTGKIIFELNGRYEWWGRITLNLKENTILFENDGCWSPEILLQVIATLAYNIDEFYEATNNEYIAQVKSYVSCVHTPKIPLKTHRIEGKLEFASKVLQLFNMERNELIKKWNPLVEVNPKRYKTLLNVLKELENADIPEAEIYGDTLYHNLMFGDMISENSGASISIVMLELINTNLPIVAAISYPEEKNGKVIERKYVFSMKNNVNYVPSIVPIALFMTTPPGSKTRKMIIKKLESLVYSY